MKSGLVLLALCVLSGAMVPRERRALDPEEIALSIPSTTENATRSQICAPQTPCAWSTYRPGTRITDLHITNNYCKCGPNTECQETEDDSIMDAIVYKCRPPVIEDEETVES